VTALPDWLVERAALGEVPPASRDRVARADAAELAARIAELRADNAAELARHPAAAAVAQLEARVAADAKRRAAERRRRRLSWLSLGGALTVAAAAVLVVTRPEPAAPAGERPEVTRVKGATRLSAFRQAGDHAEPLDEDALVRAGDLVQLRYTAGGKRHGVIASIDGAGAVTLHFPASEDARPAATALAAKPTSLAHAYALDDAPRFERFFFVTADEPIDVAASLAALRALAGRADGATASLELPAGQTQWSLRLRKPDRATSPSSP
jgi:hypothetical protein